MCRSLERVAMWVLCFDRRPTGTAVKVWIQSWRQLRTLNMCNYFDGIWCFKRSTARHFPGFAPAAAARFFFFEAKNTFMNSALDSGLFLRGAGADLAPPLPADDD